MTTLRRCIEYLNQHHIHYVHTVHANAYRAREVASAEHLPASRLAKTVIFCADGFYAMALLPTDCMIDLEELGTALGVKRIRLATEGEVAKLFPDSEIGAMPPFGNLFNLPVYMDGRLAEEHYIAFSAGTHRDAIHMKVTDYVRMAEPLCMTFAYPETVAV